MFERIITHNDLDGLFSAAICAALHGVETIVFSGPNHVSRVGISVTAADIACDLPYPGECGLWFDHHEGNLDELKRQGKDVAKIPGAFALEKSCARVIFNFYKEEYSFPGFYGESVREVDKIDSFDFKDIADWRAETPSRIINDSLKCRFNDGREEENYLLSLIPRLAEMSMAEIAGEEDVRRNFSEYLKDEEKMLEVIRKTTVFHPLDTAREFAIIDLTSFNKKMTVVRNLAQIIFPEIKGVFLVQNLFDRGVKTNDFSISGSLTLRSNGAHKNIGEIMRRLNIGDGHGGAGSGQIFCGSKAEMEKKKEEALDRIFKLWREQA
jgi:oligoribonuclease NrnB/cAMP/cGMP phosphodiesterase (DHH superfamily)